MLRERLQLEVKQIQKHLGITTLYVTHDQGEALTMSDRVCVFNDGEIAQIGSPVSLYERPQSRFIAGFVGESNFLAATVRDCVREGEGWLCTVALEGGGLATVPVTQHYADGSSLTASIRPEHIRLCLGEELAEHGLVSMTARATDVIYRGESSTLRARLESGVEIALRVDANNLAGQVGAEVRLCWAPQKMVLLNK
jgi:ABC-type Fe3+/spermidine/putrescine transport system ATPase subunit